jgi:hypothetical protein
MARGELLGDFGMPIVDEVLVAKRAYEIWDREGRPQGRDREHWLMAVAELSASVVVRRAEKVGRAGRADGVQDPDEGEGSGHRSGKKQEVAGHR